jgi:predicted Zn-dependent peptidase
VGITTVRQHLPAVVALVGKLLRDPAFPADALDERRRQLLAAVAAQRSEPGAVAGNALQRHGNPYPRGDLRHAPSFDETVTDANAVTVDAVRAVHRRFVSAAVGEFSAVGDMDVPAVQAALAQALGDWRAPAGGALAYTRAPQPLVAAPPLRQLLPTPDKPNANLLLEQPLPLNDTHPDYPAMLVANYLLGGSPNARLWARIREKDGLSYDVRSYVLWNNFELASRWQASAIFAPQNQPKVEAALQEEVARALKDGFTQKELDESRVGLLNQRRLGRAQDPAVAGALVNNLYLQRKFALQQATDDAIAALTLAQVIVYLARDTRLDRRVALKEYLPATLAMRLSTNEVMPRLPRFQEFFDRGLKSFMNEARLLGSFDHPGLVKVYRFWAEAGTAYMVMPYYEGITLKTWLADLGTPPSEAWLRQFMAPLMDALGSLHAQHCYHRDIAPDNILMLYDRAATGKGGNFLEQKPRPVLLDFGAARRVIGDATQNLTAILKSGYSPVEQYEGEETLRQGAWTDVYALCAVLYTAAVARRRVRPLRVSCATKPCRRGWRPRGGIRMPSWRPSTPAWRCGQNTARKAWRPCRS